MTALQGTLYRSLRWQQQHAHAHRKMILRDGQGRPEGGGSIQGAGVRDFHACEQREAGRFLAVVEMDDPCDRVRAPPAECESQHGRVVAGVSSREEERHRHGHGSTGGFRGRADEAAVVGERRRESGLQRYHGRDLGHAVRGHSHERQRGGLGVVVAAAPSGRYEQTPRRARHRRRHGSHPQGNSIFSVCVSIAVIDQ